MADTVAELVRHFEHIYVKHMRNLPIVNPRIQVEAVGFQDFEGNELGVLITPWFINLVLLPTGVRWQGSAQGDTSCVEFPSGPVEFAIARDDVLGTYLTAVLFRSVAEFPDQAKAREVAHRAMKALLVPAHNKRPVSRRELLTGIRGR